MAIRKEELYRLIDRLDQQDQKAAFDFLEFLVQRSKKKSKGWERIDMDVPDDEPLSEEELEQLNSKEGYVSGEDVKREFGLQVDLP
ncbi:XRE family transcriptional regulator [Neobacillus fumarioli]|uniref:XRE family transcriptional regulator n=1 Tax=Neobacillus fumarioli TaxID=105229 RepID=UPI00082B4380|nr:XRE family transcriptional regulator [Neobacillus fumarioli]